MTERFIFPLMLLWFFIAWYYILDIQTSLWLYGITFTSGVILVDIVFVFLEYRKSKLKGGKD